MKELFFLFILAFTLACNSNSEKDTKNSIEDSLKIDTSGFSKSNSQPDTLPSTDDASDPDPVIAAIRKEYRRIQSATPDTKQVKYSANPDTEAAAVGIGGTVTWFYENGKIVKILDDGMEDHGVWKEEYYFKDGNLIFVYKNNASGGAGNPTENKYQIRMYFKDGKIYKELTTRDYPVDDFERKRAIEMAKGLFKAKTAKDIANLYD